METMWTPLMPPFPSLSKAYKWMLVLHFRSSRSLPVNSEESGSLRYRPVVPTSAVT